MGISVLFFLPRTKQKQRNLIVILNKLFYFGNMAHQNFNMGQECQNQNMVLRYQFFQDAIIHAIAKSGTFIDIQKFRKLLFCAAFMRSYDVG